MTQEEKLAKAIVKEKKAQKRKDEAWKALGNLLVVIILFPASVWFLVVLSTT